MNLPSYLGFCAMICSSLWRVVNVFSYSINVQLKHKTIRIHPLPTHADRVARSVRDDTDVFLGFTSPSRI